ncbi:lipopolysaccharide transport periplasmic protein LptA [Thorsellia kenyensis]|uniref:Lipopolysaccharide export system protein LptA n=1 Tax=Thorsellia kenyensis TaxID=1549888 RepID=A0ABV6C6T1_9GAMM
MKNNFLKRYTFINLIKKTACLSLIILSSTTLSVTAKTGDTDEPMHITSDDQSLDMTNSVATFTNNVVITQGTIKITADKVVVTTPGGDQEKAIIDAYGSPLTFYQLQDDGLPIEGNANHMRYELASEKITLNGNAYISQVDSHVKGENIIYLVKEQRLEAKGKKVTTVLNPKQAEKK